MDTKKKLIIAGIVGVVILGIVLLLLSSKPSTPPPAAVCPKTDCSSCKSTCPPPTTCAKLDCSTCKSDCPPCNCPACPACDCPTCPACDCPPIPSNCVTVCDGCFTIKVAAPTNNLQNFLGVDAKSQTLIMTEPRNAAIWQKDEDGVVYTLMNNEKYMIGFNGNGAPAALSTYNPANGNKYALTTFDTTDNDNNPVKDAYRLTTNVGSNQPLYALFYYKENLAISDSYFYPGMANVVYLVQ